MKKGDIALTPQIAFTGTKATITAWAGAVLGMEAVTTDTAEKGTYDGAAWQWSPIAGGGGGGTWGSITGALSSQTDLQTALNGKVDENSPITGATKTKITYDINGLVTSGTDATTADISDSTNKRYVTDAQLTVIGNTSGTNTGDSASQPLDADLTAIAGLTPSNDDIIQRKAGSWVSRTMAQLITDLTSGLSALFAPITIVPTGWVSPYAGSSAPSGYLLCDGAAISRSTYSGLFSVIGTTYGAGNGTTTFNVPNLKGKVPVGFDSTQTEFDALGETGGSKSVALSSAENGLHSHTTAITASETGHSHTVNNHQHNVNPHAHEIWANARYVTGLVGAGGNGSAPSSTGFAFSLSTGSTGGLTDAQAPGTNSQTPSITVAGQGTGSSGSGTAHQNLQPYIALNYLIKT